MKSTARLYQGLRIAAIVALLTTLAVWIGTGSHVGWTQTTITTLQHDDVTGIDYPVHQSGFIAGVEVLAIGVVTAAVLAAASFISPVSYTHLRAHETPEHLVCRLLL